jgi:hypothetical protein
MAEPFAGFLLGGDGVEGGAQVIPDRRYGVLAAKERDRVLELAAEVAQLERGQCGQGMLRRVYCWRLLWDGGRWYRRRSLRGMAGVISLPNVSGRCKNRQ